MFPFAFCFCLVLFGVWVVGVCFLWCLCWVFVLELAPLCSDFAPLLNPQRGIQSMHLRNSFISTTRCDDLARATEAQDGKKDKVTPRACRCCCCILFTLYVSPSFHFQFTLISFHTARHIEAIDAHWCLLCRHGFVMRSPGSWLGGSWVSALRLFCLAPPGHL